MRQIQLTFVAAVAALAACATPPPPPPPAPPPPPPPPPAAKVDPVVIDDVQVTGQTLIGGTIRVSLSLAPGVTATEAQAVAKVGDRTLAETTATLDGDDARHPTVDVPFEFGKDLESLQPFQDTDVTEVALELTIAGEKRTRAVRVRSPLLPRVSILSVHASREEPKVLAVTYRVEIKNPNPFDIRAGALTYEAGLDGKTLLKSELIGGKVPGSSNAEFELPTQATPDNCGKDFATIVKKPSADWTFRGSLSVQGVAIPVDVSGTLKLSQ